MQTAHIFTITKGKVKRAEWHIVTHDSTGYCSHVDLQGLSKYVPLFVFG